MEPFDEDYTKTNEDFNLMRNECFILTLEYMNDSSEELLKELNEAKIRLKNKYGYDYDKENSLISK